MNNYDLEIKNNTEPKNHISRENLLAFRKDKMSLQERELFLNHICSCLYCSEQLSDFISEEIISAPSDMKENILRAVNRQEVQLIKKAKKTSKSIQLFIYSLKVGMATVGALFFLLVTVNSSNQIDSAYYQKYQDSQISNPVTTAINSRINILSTGMSEISSSMLEFSNDIITRR